MKANPFLTMLLCALGFSSAAQENPTQTIRGKVVDAQTEIPLIGANVIVVGSEPFIGSSTDLDGKFRLENVPVGRQTLRITYLGYENRELPNILVTTGKEMVLEISLQESVNSLKEVVVEADVERGETMNKMATVSARTFGVEETKRYAGALDDPSRMASSYAGVGIVDGDNDLIIRGNSPRGMLWRMEGVEIPNPNHFSNQGASGGPVSMLSSNMMTNSEFFTGAFPGEFGNAFSGVFDISLRRGNNEQREYAFQVGILGTDMAVEGPFSKNYNGSYLVNYRYSTLSMFSALGIDIVGDIIPKFQDLSYNIDLPTKKAGNFSVFGLAGNSFVDDSYRHRGYDITDKYTTNMGVTGLKHAYVIGEKTLIKSVAAVMGTQRLYEAKMHDTNGVYLREGATENFEDMAFRFTTGLTHKFSAKHTLKAGVIYNRLMFGYFSEYYDIPAEKTIQQQDVSDQTDRIQAYAQWQYRLSPRLTLNPGLHHTYFALNGEHVLEPRLGAKYELNEKSSLNLGFGMHSSTHDPSVYFAQDQLPNGTYHTPNKNLKMIKALHYVLGYDRMFGDDIHAKVELYYQQLYDVPIENDASSSFSLLNWRAGYASFDMTNAGTGHNYGAELTLEKYFTNQYFFMVTSSLYESKYIGGDGVVRNTLWNGNYVNNFQFGKEFNVAGPKKVFGVSAKGVWAGGQRFTPILLEESRAAGQAVYDDSRVFEERMQDYFRVDLQLTYRINRPKTAHFIKLDIQNASNRENLYNEYYDIETQEIEKSTMVGILPVLSYKIQF